MKAQELGIRAFLHAIEEGGLNAGDARLQIMPEVNDKRHAATESLPIMVPREIDLH